MIFFHYVKWRNFLSTGQHFTEIDLASDKTSLIVGENGAGKSTMLDAVSFALFGKPFRKINKPQLMNSINKKQLEVEICFNIASDKYVIKRGLKPNYFEIWKNGEMLNQDAAARDYQAYLEQNILKMNFKSFGQIVVLGSSTFVPFMQLSAAHRREVIEDLLDIQVFTSMSNLLKEKIADNKTSTMDVKYQESLIQNKIDSAEEHNEEIRKLKSLEIDRIRSKVKEQLDFIDEQQKCIDHLETIIGDCIRGNEDRDLVNNKHEKLRDMKSKIETRKTKLLKEIDFYKDHDNCPTCKQGIEHDFKEHTIQDNTDNVQKIEDAEIELQERMKELQERLEEIAATDDVANKSTLKIGEHRANIRMSKNTLNQIKQDLEQAEKEVEEVDTTKIEQLKKELSNAMALAETLSKQKDILSVSQTILKDGGIKTRIIRQYVPIINNLINKYLAALEFVVHFELDEQFNETIKSRFRDEFSYGSFSEGEKLRIDLAILFTWRAIAKMRNSVSTNLLIMDEVMDGSMDANGVDEFIKIIKELTSDTNTFIISHKTDAIMDKFDRTIQFVKEKGFSRISE